MAARYLTTPPPEQTTMPHGVPYIVGNEAAERFSFYGMKAVLAVFMTRYLLNAAGQPDHMSDAQASIWVHNFVTAVYLFPIFGAVIADWLLGKYRTILLLSLVYCLGHAILALMDFHTGVDQKTLLFWGLVLISVGAGGIKPCVSAHVGDQFGRGNQFLLPVVFGWFYFSINFGSTFSTILTPWLLEHKSYGPSWAFGVPGVLMALATLVFWLGRHKFVHVPPAGNRFFEETFNAEGLRAMGNLIPLFIFVAMFWALFDQTASRWVLQAEKMDRDIVLPFSVPFLKASESPVAPRAEVAIDASEAAPVALDPRAELRRDGRVLSFSAAQLQAANPILVMLMIPLFTYVIYPGLNRLFPLTPLRKIGIGLFMTSISFAIAAGIEARIGAGETPHMSWQLLAYVVITASEIMVSITSLEFAYTQAPNEIKSFIMGLYLLSTALGNFFTSKVNAVVEMLENRGSDLLTGPRYYWFFVACMLLTSVLYVVWSQFYRGRTYIRGEEPADETVAPVGPRGESAP